MQKKQKTTSATAIGDEYASQLKRVYKEIDKFSCLMTPMRDEQECIRDPLRKRITRTRGSTTTKASTTITSKAASSTTSSNQHNPEEHKSGGVKNNSKNQKAIASNSNGIVVKEKNWQDDTNAQLGYGEITAVSIDHL